MIVRRLLSSKNLKQSRYIFNCYYPLRKNSSNASAADLVANCNCIKINFLSYLYTLDSVSLITCSITLFRISNFMSGNTHDQSNGWTGDIDYLVESGSVIFSGKGISSVEQGVDDHVMVGGLKKSILNASAVAKLVEIVKRWKWGPAMETQLDRLQFAPNMTHIMQAMKIIRDGETFLSSFQWAKRQPWYSPNDDCYVTLSLIR